MAELDFEKPENKILLGNLYAFAHALFFRMYKKEPNHKTKGFRDYVHDAILKHEDNPHKFDSSLGSLENYLKFYLIRRLMSNDMPSKGKKLRAESFGEEAGKKQEKVQKTDFQKKDYDEPDWEGERIDELDDTLIFKAIEDELKSDDVAGQIYLAVFHDKYNFSDRAEICEAFGIPDKEFDKARKRLQTIMKRVFKKLKLIK